MKKNNSNPTTQAEWLAGEVLHAAVTSLLLNLRFLESALFRLRPQPERTTFATDGAKLFYGYEFLFSTYHQDPAELTRGYLHTLLHCIFRHPFVSTAVDRGVWDFACDIAVEAAIEDLDMRLFRTARGRKLQPLLARLRQEGVRLTAEKLYHFFMTHPGTLRDMLTAAADFHFCDHSPWYVHDGKKDPDPDPDNPSGETGNGSGAPRPHQNESSGPPAEISGMNSGQAGGSAEQESSGDCSASAGQMQTLEAGNRRAMAQQWTDISRHVQIAMETFGKRAGTEPGQLMQELQALNRERYDYRSFLLKFAVRQEVLKINDDEFDYIFYTYGLELYGNVPLIEPLEYKEDHRIREFAIVIDTSGSTSGSLVQSFLQKTYNILKSTETFASRIRLRIIQCDAAVQESVLLESQDQFDAYIQNFTIKGLGGTDFRPAFAHVDELVRSGELPRLKGLVYFTDGYGIFPKQKPDYDTAFVFVQDDDAEPPSVPPWAIKLVLDQDEVAAI